MRLIDADRLTLGFRIADKTWGTKGLLPFIEQAIEHAPTVDPLKTAREKIVAFDKELGEPSDENYFGKGLAHGLKYCFGL